jgi:uncharacterized MAPEG superfamily protein
MTIPLWTLLIATLLPYVWFTLSNPLRKQEFGSLDNNHPRIQEAKQTGRGARASGASANAFEALAVYAPAVLVAHLLAPASELAPKLAIIWVALRVGHGIAYIADKPALRTTFFAFGSLVAILMYFVGAHVL